ncbi:hypothetical protein OAG76_03715 [Rubripirellula sp.]|jgi:hypothetical protein|nr:hypothetical protein [Rubripirellula sp.]MDA7492822.1 hypothetical protein [bacterium]MDB4634493.1 hypothetical protein [Rubripirellula sp.]MDC0317009.1 hypothetical protein [bacterium]
MSEHFAAITEFHIGFTQFGNNLIHCVAFLRHSENPFQAVRPIKILSLTVVQSMEGGQPRDLTDSMYNPKSWPHVSHLEEDALIVSHIERHVSPTLTSDQFTDGKPFRFTPITAAR